MQLPKQKTWIIFMLMFVFLFLGTFSNFAVHELSHLITMLLCNGSVKSIQIGTISYIGGYINPKYISIVAMSSLIFPTLITVFMSCTKKFYPSVFFFGFSFPNIVNAVLGLFAAYFIHDTTRSTYDVALAYDNTNMPWVVVALAIILLAVNACLLLTKIKLFVNINKDG